MSEAKRGRINPGGAHRPGHLATRVECIGEAEFERGAIEHVGLID
jgi:hypothetical protein